MSFVKTLGAAAVFSVAAAAAQAAVVSVFSEGGFVATSTIENDGADQVKVTLEVDTSTGILGDMRGWFFDVDTNIGIIDISGDITDAQENTSDLGQGANVNPLGPFDFGIEFGTPGIGANDVQMTMFTLIGSGLSEASFGDQALRVTSVGPDGDREGSLKLSGGTPPPPPPSEVPLPASGLLIFAGLGGLALFRRKS